MEPPRDEPISSESERAAGATGWRLRHRADMSVNWPSGARMPIPGNAEWALWFIVEVLFAIIWAASDAVDAGALRDGRPRSSPSAT